MNTETKRTLALALTCPACPGSEFTSWPSHYRTRAHRESLARRQAVARQADAFMSAVGRWTSLHVDDADWPLHLQREADGKWVATIYPPDALDAVLGAAAQRVVRYAPNSPLAQAQAESRTPRYWRGESYAGLDEALRNAALALTTEGWPEGRA